MARLEHGTSLVIPAGATAQVAASIPLVEVRFSAPTAASLVVPESFPGNIGRTVTFLRGAYVRISQDVGTVPSGTVLLLHEGTIVEIAGKATTMPGDQMVCSPCDSSPLQTVGLMFVAVVLGGLLVSAMLKE